jgi:hypothetical protein
MKIKSFCAVAVLAASLVANVQAKDEFVVHEWGTFTSVQGGDGGQIVWRPSIATDLPKFVYSREVRNGGFGGNALSDPIGKGVMVSFVRMETPVIYFYSDQERTADVRVKFPQGRVTEWYPQATHVGPYATTNKGEFARANQSVIEWSGVKILPRKTKEISAKQLIRDADGKEANHYYAAREVDANFLRMSAPHARTGVEYERDLFYRGIGYFQAPLTVQSDGSDNQLRLSTKSAEPLTDLFVLTIHQGQARYQTLDKLEAGSDHGATLDAKPFAPLREVRAKLMREMAKALTRQGLYAKEAEAMVNTWKDQWFEEEGTRVLYLLPAQWTEQTLPLEITPRPEKIARVMVGRAEFITPSTERQLSKLVTAYNAGNAIAKQQAIAEVRRLGLGRFLEPATRKIVGKGTDKAFTQAAWEVANEASKPVGKGPAVVEKQPAGVNPETAFIPNVFGTAN